MARPKRHLFDQIRTQASFAMWVRRVEITFAF
jgi:hypothetical protein